MRTNFGIPLSKSKIKLNYLIFTRFLLGVLSSFALFACTTVKTPEEFAKGVPPNLPAWRAREARLATLPSWDAQGVMSFKESSRAWSGNVHWQQVGQQYQLNISGPAGASPIKIAGDAREVTLWDSQGKKTTAENPDQLIQQQLSWNLPVMNLHYWLRSIPNPAQVAKIDFIDGVLVNRMIQNEWVVHYADYKPFQGLLLPTKIVMEHAPYVMKIVINQWQLPGQ